MKRFAAVMLMIVLCMSSVQPLYVNAKVHDSRIMDYQRKAGGKGSDEQGDADTDEEDEADDLRDRLLSHYWVKYNNMTYMIVQFFPDGTCKEYWYEASDTYEWNETYVLDGKVTEQNYYSGTYELNGKELTVVTLDTRGGQELRKSTTYLFHNAGEPEEVGDTAGEAHGFYQGDTYFYEKDYVRSEYRGYPDPKPASPMFIGMLGEKESSQETLFDLLTRHYWQSGIQSPCVSEFLTDNTYIQYMFAPDEQGYDDFDPESRGAVIYSVGTYELNGLELTVRRLVDGIEYTTVFLFHDSDDPDPDEPGYDAADYVGRHYDGDRYFYEKDYVMPAYGDFDVKPGEYLGLLDEKESVKEESQQAGEKENPQEEYDQVVWGCVVRQKKGRTILYVGCDGEPDKEYRLFVLQDGEDITTQKVADMRIIDSDGFDIEYDFSTMLQLPSGDYSFIVAEASASVDELDQIKPYEYTYDESFKTDEDDQYGNEREYRRLLSMVEDAGSDPMQNEELKENIRNRLASFGLSDSRIKKIIKYLETAEQPYLDLYLYSFYRYSYTTPKESGSSKCFFSPTANVINWIESGLNDNVTFFHEAGHAVDWYSGISDDYTWISEEGGDKLFDTMKYDLSLFVSASVDIWLLANKISITKEELTALIVDQFCNAKNEINKEDFKDDSISESDQRKCYEAYSFVEAELKSYMPGGLNAWAFLYSPSIYLAPFIKYKFQFFAGGDSDMRDAYMGLTNNKIANEILGESSTLHSGGYWWIAGNEDTPDKYKDNLFAEAWAEYYASMLTKDSAMQKQNRILLPNTCDVFDRMSWNMLSVLKNSY